MVLLEWEERIAIQREGIGLLLLVLFSLIGCDLAISNRSPVAILEAAPIRGEAPLTVEFDGSLSTDPDGLIVRYRWDFGDGTSGNGPLVTHTYTSDGVYLATLSVVDEKGGQDEDRGRIVVGNPPSEALFSASPRSGWAPLTVNFDGSESFNPNGYGISMYEWDFGDGQRATGATPNHTYDDPGAYLVNLTIVDRNGNSSSAEIPIQVLGMRNARDLRSGSGPTAMISVDMDGDGNRDLVVANSESDDISILYGGGGNLLFPSSSRVTVGEQPVKIASGDFDHNGRPDLAIANFKSGILSLLMNEGSRNFGDEIRITIGRWISSVIADDFDRDGNIDLAAADAGHDKLVILLGDGTGQFSQVEGVAVGDSPEDLASGDFNGDGRPDLAVTNFFDNTVQILLGNGIGGFNPSSTIRVGAGPTSIRANYFNGDDRLDLIVTNSTGDTVSILVGSSDGRFAQSQVVAVGRGVRDADVADFDGDGRFDLAVANAGSDTVALLLNDGVDQFTRERLKEFDEGESPSGLVIDDFDRDGFPDVAVIFFDENRVTILINQL